MQFQVPQFIDQEDKLFGPFTFKQFIYLVGGVMGAFGLYLILVNNMGLPKMVGYLVPAPILGLGLALAFYKINGRPFIFTMRAFIEYYRKSRLYTWDRQTKKTKTMTPEEQYAAITNEPRINNHSVSERSLDVEIVGDTAERERAIEPRINLQI